MPARHPAHVYNPADKYYHDAIIRIPSDLSGAFGHVDA
jgi:hypothetical protein